MKHLFLKGITALPFIVVFFCMSCKREALQQQSATVDCRITRIITKAPWAENKSGNFTYNSFGDPVAFTPDNLGGFVKYEFRYDQDHRLTDYIGYYSFGSSNGVFEFWTKYIYDNKNRIIRDTTYHYGKYGAVPTSYTHVKEVTTYEYDKQDRITGTVLRQLYNGAPNGIMGDYRYVYNGQGNLVTPGSTYDDKVSIYRTSKIWMFLNRNYSKNNSGTARGYNSKGLPSGFGSSVQQASYSILYSLGLSDCEIVYDCK
ncbi:MAG: hypothetical protein WCF67_16520 [Chitinophagaceae bacterium]